MISFFHKGEPARLSKILRRDHPEIGYGALQMLFRKKDIKLNGERICADTTIGEGDRVEIYFVMPKRRELEIVFEDDNILVVNKPKGIESVGGEGTCEGLVSQRCFVLAVHRLDRNTDGLLIFAKNQDALSALVTALKEGGIKKYYTAAVFGTMEKKSATLIAYHKKDEKNSLAKISDTKREGFQKIETTYEVVSESGGNSVLRVLLKRGKLHQIRAHLAHIGHFVLGDGKYGNNQTNKSLGQKYQQLCADEIVFDSLPPPLNYLNGKKIALT